MKLKNSLRFRLVISFAAFAAVLAILYGFSVWIAVVWSEDNSLEQRLKTELQYYLEVVGPNTPAYERLDRYISSYIGHSTLPKSYQRLISHEDGIVEQARVDTRLVLAALVLELVVARGEHFVEQQDVRVDRGRDRKADACAHAR